MNQARHDRMLREVRKVKTERIARHCAGKPRYRVTMNASATVLSEYRLCGFTQTLVRYRVVHAETYKGRRELKTVCQ